MKYIILLMSVSLIAQTSFAKKRNSDEIHKACFDLASRAIDIKDKGVIVLAGKNEYGDCTVTISSKISTSGNTKEPTGILEVIMRSDPDENNYSITGSKLFFNDALTSQRVRVCKYKKNTLTYKNSVKYKTGWRKLFRYKTNITFDDNGEITQVKVSQRVKSYRPGFTCNIDFSKRI